MVYGTGRFYNNKHHNHQPTIIRRVYPHMFDD